SCTVLPLQSPLSLYIYTLSLHDALPILLPNVTHRLETNRIQTVSALVTGAFLLTACGSSPDTTVTTEYYRFADQPQDNDVPDAELDEDVLTGLDDHYFRRLGVRDSTEFYMARTDHEETTSQGLCFIAVEHDSETTASQLQSRFEFVCLLLLEKNTTQRSHCNTCY